MILIDELTREHDLIEQVAGSFLTYTRGPALRECREDGRAFVRFFRLYANDFHHAREEACLLAALRERANLPGDRGPIKVIIDEHAEMGGVLRALASRLGDGEAGGAGAEETAALATAYVHALWHHIDAENSVLFPESEPRLRRVGLSELPSRPMTADERAAMEAGLDLVRRYPPVLDDGVMRGDGCVMCPAFTNTCRGLEAEWWNEWDWDEFEDHLNAG